MALRINTLYLWLLLTILMAIGTAQIYPDEQKKDQPNTQLPVTPTSAPMPITPTPLAGAKAVPDKSGQAVPGKEEPKPMSPALCGIGALPCKKGEIDQGNNLISTFYQIATEYGNSFVSLLDQWKSKDGKIIYSEKFQLLTVTDHKENIALMEQVMQISDIAAPQVMIEAQILERNITSDLELGWDATFNKPANSKTFFQSLDEKFWPGAYMTSLQSIIPTLPTGTVAPGAFVQGSTFSFVTTGKRGTADIKFRLMVERNEATILSSPRVTVGSGSKAMISSGQEVPFLAVTLAGTVATNSITYKSADIKMEVTPTVIGGNNIKMLITPEVKTVTSYQVLQGVETPVFATRRSETTVTVQSGEIIHIGGLTRDEDVVYERAIPLISDIPLIGNLFKRHQHDRNKTEIIFILKPTIVTKAEDTIRPSIITK